MECLRNYIGILGCGSTTPESSLFVNGLPGISLQSVDKLADSEQKTYLGVFRDAETRALRRFPIALDAAFKKRYQIRNITHGFDLGRMVDLVTAETAAADEQRGFAVDCDYPAAEWLTGSSLRMVSCQDLALYVKVVPGSGAITIKIFDLDTKQVLFTTDLDAALLSMGWNRIPVNQCFSADRIFCAYNATDLASAQLEISPLLSNGFSSYINSWVGSACSNCDPCHPNIRGLKSANDLSTPVYGSSTYGLSGIFSLVCKYEGFVCANKAAFAVPFWYLLGSELQVERAYNKARINKWTQDPKEAFDLKGYFDMQFEETLQSVVDGIDLNLADLCLKCNQDVQIKSNLP